MNKMTFFIVAFFAVFLSSNGQTTQQSYLEYINQYADLAMEQQQLHRIPASITLAQGLLESMAGKSTLARDANNHFGIKCNDWNGEGIYQDDDKASECFRKYNTVRESYEDHSMFLKYRPRYTSLFQLNPTDYKGWANGLQKAGYATDPGYAAKLIKLIENYGLHKFDEKNRKGTYEIINHQANKSNASVSGFGRVLTTSLKGHQIYRNNGVKCVFAEAGDTYASIANEFGIKLNKILSYNDLKEEKELASGNVIYLAKKKNKASREFHTHQVKKGETMYFISQKYAVKLQKLYDLNQLPYSQGATIDEVLKLR